MKICLDAGHGAGYNPSPADPVYREGDRMFALQGYLQQALEERGVTVVTTRQTVTDDPDLLRRGAMAAGCDLLLSLHSNAVGNEVNDVVDYVAVFYPVSGRHQTLAQTLAEVIAATIGTRQIPQSLVRWNSAHTADYYGIIRNSVAAGTPALLLEHSFHTHPEVTRWLLNDANLRRLAQAEAAVIAEYYGLEEPETRYELLKDITSADYRPTVEKLLAKGVLFGRGGSGENTVIDLGEDAVRLLVLLDRAGVFGE